MLITKEVEIKWRKNNKDWYESKGCIFTKLGDVFNVKVADLLVGSTTLVNIECDACGETLIGVRWCDYIKCVKEDGKYYCQRCAKNGYKKWVSFYDWCYKYLPKEMADWVLSRWDYEKNIDKDGNKLSPKDVSFASLGLNKKGYWFKCLDYPEHGSELKNIASFINKHGSITCNQCNTIAITHPELINYLVNKKDAYKYSYGSGKEIFMECPDCGYEKKMTINKLVSQGFGCNRCSDGISYSEKFLLNVFEQLLNKNFQTQLTKTTFKWCNNYKYDFYLGKINGVIETHGIQHYEEIKSKWKFKYSLAETQDNDFDKEWLARSNKIKNYIILDCRESNLKWIRNSVMKSRLPILLGFKSEDINWLKCHEFACSSLVKIVCDLWNYKIRNVPKIAKKIKMNNTTIRKYLKQGNELKWCNYNGKEEQKSNKEYNYKKVICLTTDEIFNSIKEASKYYNIDDCGISGCCSNNNSQKTAGKHPETKEPLIWMYYENYLIRNQILGGCDEYINNHNNVNYKKVICINTKKVFQSLKEAVSKYNNIFSSSSLSQCCKHKSNSCGKDLKTGEKLKWMYYDEYLKLQTPLSEELSIQDNSFSILQ